MHKFPIFHQHDANDCGPACLRMISHFYGKSYSLETLRDKSFINSQGVSLLGISDAAESVGFRTRGLKLTYNQLQKDIALPCIAHWNQEHFVIVRKVSKDSVDVVDPAFGAIRYTKAEFLKCWASTIEEGQSFGVCLQLQPAPEFYQAEDEKIDRRSFRFLLSYLKPYGRLLFQIVLGVTLGAILQVIFPFLFQTIVDKGVIIPNPSLIYTILIAQIILVTSRFSLEFIRNWIILHLGARVNIFLVSDFLIKLMQLPIAFFDSKNRGDLLQRVADHKRIEQFLTNTTIELFHSVFSITIMGAVLALFDVRIFLIFLVGSILYILWTVRFMKRRRELDQRKFAQLSNNQSTLIQILSGMHEIKLNNCEKRKRWEWEDIQAKLFRINLKGLTLLQKQRAGALVFNQYKDVLIVVFAAVMVLNGEMTLGAMVAISYVIGQLSGPIDQLIDFLHSTQDAKISLDRLAEIHDKENDEVDDGAKTTSLDLEHDISIRNMSFQYEGPNSPFVLKNLNITIPRNKITAIVGTSGSGKTTLVKMLLSFYHPVEGGIYVGDTNLQNVSPGYWRGLCGVVMQDGYLFSESIAQNIALSDTSIDKEKLFYAARMANVQPIISDLPLGYNTKIGPDGHGLSQGQKQRILIARALYKNPSYLFFDEATNALDANNEKLIMENLYDYFEGRTVVVVAHRLSTVKNADQIVVLERGEIIEIGNHEELTQKKGSYYKLVKNQLELGV